MIRLLSWNIRDAIYGTPYLQTLHKNSDVCFFLTEHWLNQTNISCFDSITEDLHIVYSSSKYCSNSSNGSGGTAIVIRNQKGLKSKTSKLKMIEHVVHFCQMKVIKICVYCALSYLLLITHKMCTLIIYIYMYCHVFMID